MSKRGKVMVLVGLAVVGVLIASAAGWLAVGRPSGTPLPYAQFLDEVGADAVDRVWQTGNQLTVLMGGETFLVVIPTGSDVVADVAAQAAAHPGVDGTTIMVEIEQIEPVGAWPAIVVTGVLSIALAVGLLGWARSVLRRDLPGGSSSAAAG